MTIKDVNLNSSESMGQLGNFPLGAETKNFSNLHIAVIAVSSGTCTVSGKQHINNPEGLDIFPAWVNVILPVGTWIVNLKDVTVVSSATAIAYYGG